jgi:hypothetical protein
LRQLRRPCERPLLIELSTPLEWPERRRGRPTGCRGPRGRERRVLNDSSTGPDRRFWRMRSHDEAARASGPLSAGPERVVLGPRTDDFVLVLLADVARSRERVAVNDAPRWASATSCKVDWVWGLAHEPDHFRFSITVQPQYGGRRKSLRTAEGGTGAAADFSRTRVVLALTALLNTVDAPGNDSCDDEPSSRRRCFPESRVDMFDDWALNRFRVMGGGSQRHSRLPGVRPLRIIPDRALDRAHVSAP